jgi:hypothetical protein
VPSLRLIYGLYDESNVFVKKKEVFVCYEQDWLAKQVEKGRLGKQPGASEIATRGPDGPFLFRSGGCGKTRITWASRSHRVDFQYI